MFVEEIVRKTIIIRSKTTFQMSILEALLTTRRNSAR